MRVPIFVVTRREFFKAVVGTAGLAVISSLLEGCDRKEKEMARNGVVLRSAMEEHTYELHATYFTYDVAKGVVTGRDEVIGSFIRKPHQGGEAADAFEWIEARVGHADSREAAIAEWRDLAYTKGFSYVFDFEAQFDKFPIDTSPIPRDPDGWFFYVHILDSHNQFDILRTRRYGKADELEKPGDSVVRDHSEHFDLEDWAPFIHCQFDKSSKFNVTTWVGVGEYAGQAANVLYYRCDDIPMKIEVIPAELKVSGMTNYHGHIYVAKESGVLLGGDLFEYLPLTSGYQHREVYLKMLK